MIDLRPDHLDTVERILAEHVPECEVRAFGSRAAWTAKDYSDLDLAVVGAGSLDWRTLGRLRGSLRGIEPAHAGGRPRLARHPRQLPAGDRARLRSLAGGGEATDSG